MTGLQDNGSVRTWTATTPPSDLTQWNAYNGGDGHYTVIDPSDHTYYYACFQPVSAAIHKAPAPAAVMPMRYPSW